MFILIIIILAVVAVVCYNALTRNRVEVDESYSQIDVQLKRRNDLIPNLIETVKGYRDFEQETLTKIVELRNQVVNANSAKEAMQASDQLTKSINNIFVTAEAYPELRASQNFLNLQEELTNTENKIAYARQLYNSSVAVYNKRRQVFPTVIIAQLFHFEAMDYLDVPEEDKKAPEVKF
jgi:LemA protein